VVDHAAHPQCHAEVKVEDPKVDLALAALSDPTRRAVLQLLSRGPQRAGELAQALAMSPPALSRHLRVLRRSGLIVDDEPAHDARVRLYRVEPQGFAPVLGWLDELESDWSEQLSAFKAHAERRVAAKPEVAGRAAAGSAVGRTTRKTTGRTR
jgi:DNA-binding transcriptional ArsR family regulator